MNTYNANQIAAILFNLDPMSTACVQNGLFQEYQSEANLIVDHLAICKEGIQQAVKAVFHFYFWENCITQQQIEEIANEISKSTRVHQRP